MAANLERRVAAVERDNALLNTRLDEERRDAEAKARHRALELDGLQGTERSAWPAGVLRLVEAAEAQAAARVEQQRQARLFRTQLTLSRHRCDEISR